VDNLEPKKLALLRVLQILKKHSDYDHRLKQEEIADLLEKEYGIVLERKAISRNISLLKEAGYEIESTKSGAFLAVRDFEDSELRLLIDGVLSGKYITAKHSKDLINRLSAMSNRYFRSHIKNVYSVNDWSKTDNQALFYNIEIIDDAIEQRKQIKFDYNKYGIDKKLHKTTTHYVSPYQLVLHNQRYYLMSRSEYWKGLAYFRLDHITKISITDKPLVPITEMPGFESGINYKVLASSLPYMYTDRVRNVEFIADLSIIDQIIDWFGMDIKITEIDDKKISVTVKVSLMAMEHWAMQYINHVEITSPTELRDKIKEKLEAAVKKYN